MKDYREFENRVSKSLNLMEAKISYMNKGVKELSAAFHEFHEDISDYMSFTAEAYADHEKRLSNLENKIK